MKHPMDVTRELQDKTFEAQREAFQVESSKPLGVDLAKDKKETIVIKDYPKE